MNFEYLKTEKYDDSIDIDNPGNCCIRAYCDDGSMYLLSIRTDLGWSTIRTLGPLNDESQVSYFSYTRRIIEYKESKIYKIIRDFLNKDRTEFPITQVEEIPEGVVDEIIKNIKF